MGYGEVGSGLTARTSRNRAPIGTWRFARDGCIGRRDAYEGFHVSINTLGKRQPAHILTQSQTRPHNARLDRIRSLRLHTPSKKMDNLMLRQEPKHRHQRFSKQRHVNVFLCIPECLCGRRVEQHASNFVCEVLREHAEGYFLHFGSRDESCGTAKVDAAYECDVG